MPKQLENLLNIGVTLLKRYSIKLRYLLPGLFSLFIIIPLLLLGTISYKVSSTTIQDKLVRSLDQSVAMSKTSFQDMFQTMESTLNIVASNRVFQEAQGDDKANREIAALLDSTARFNSDIHNLYYIPLNGAGISAVNPGVLAQNPQQAEGYKMALEGSTRIIWTDAYPSLFTGDSVISGLKEVTNADGNVIGVLGLDMEVYRISEATFDIKIGATGYLMIMDNRGNILSHPDFNQLGEKFADTDTVNQLYKNETGQFRYSEAGGFLFL